MTALVIAEHDNQALRPVTLNVLGAAAKLGDVHVLVAGNNCAAVAEQAAGISGVSKVLLCEHADLAEGLPEPLSALVVANADAYSHLLGPASTFGKNLMPRVAALLDVAQVSDVIEIIDADTFKRPIYAGNAIATVRAEDARKVLTVRGTAFDAAAVGGDAAPVESIAAAAAEPVSRFVSRELSESERPELTEAKVIVSGGRALGSAEKFALIEQLADKLGAAIGASRAAVDAGYVSNDLQVGQTGKIVAPELYIAIGISGAIQHLAGMKDSRVIVAINSDEEAPIFEIADYGLVGDLFDVVPALIAALD